MASVRSQRYKEEKCLDHSFRDDLESEDFVGKVSKFEFLSHNATSPTSSADKKRWALFEGMRFPSRDEQQSISPKRKFDSVLYEVNVLLNNWNAVLACTLVELRSFAEAKVISIKCFLSSNCRLAFPTSFSTVNFSIII